MSPDSELLTEEVEKPTLEGTRVARQQYSPKSGETRSRLGLTKKPKAYGHVSDPGKEVTSLNGIHKKRQSEAGIPMFIDDLLKNNKVINSELRMLRKYNKRERLYNIFPKMISSKVILPNISAFSRITVPQNTFHRTK